MVLNLFSVFDPSTSSNFSLNWLSMLLGLFIFFPLYWYNMSRCLYIYDVIIKFLLKEFESNFNKLNYKVFFFFMGLFWFVCMNNFLGLFPYIFTSTSHLSVTLGISLNLWILFMLFGWLNKMNLMFAHLVPLGSPIYLSFFMVLIETVSNLIRPITLSVRLAANMIAGHLLLTLLSNLSEYNFIIFPFSLPVMISLMILEMAVSLIQSYVFITLLSLYLNEI
uniref:ATP synthase subunit a n=1 Tax=Echinolaelaps echidninus TaxID=2759148 RepID=A0AB74RXP5_9ACAR